MSNGIEGFEGFATVFECLLELECSSFALDDKEGRRKCAEVLAKHHIACIEAIAALVASEGEVSE